MESDSKVSRVSLDKYVSFCALSEKPIFFSSGVGIRHVDSSGVPMRTTIYHNGTLRATSRYFTISTWCSVDDRSVKIWPHEHVKCNIHIFLANALDAGLARMDDHSPVVQQSENSQWSISLVDMTLKEGQITYTIVLKRNESFIDSLFGTPLNFALIMLICSIFMRQSIYRIFIVLLAALILFVTFLTLTKHVPPFYTPVIGKVFKYFLITNSIIKTFNFSSTLLWSLWTFTLRSNLPDCLAPFH